MQTQLRQLPSVDKLLQNDQLAALTEIHGHALVVDAIRAELTTALRRIIRRPAASAERSLKRRLPPELQYGPPCSRLSTQLGHHSTPTWAGRC
jgi:hypothetical protein